MYESGYTDRNKQLRKKLLKIPTRTVGILLKPIEYPVYATL